MNNPFFSVIIPHKHTPMNDRALMMNIDMLYEYAQYPFELIIDDTPIKDPYKIWNEASAHARGEILIFTNSDVLMGPGWAKPLIQHCKYNTIVTGYLLEPGNIGVATQNIQIDFGRNPDQFEMTKFENWVLPHIDPNWVKEERGWYMPCAMSNDWFHSTGGFDTTIPFPHPSDIVFWERCIKEYNTKLLRVKSFAYHFQNLSGRS